MEVKVYNGHTLTSLVAEEQLFEAADLNNISITDALTPGVTLLVPEVSKPIKLVERLAFAPALQLTRSLPGQAWIDLVLQEVGEEDQLFVMADLNNASITDDVATGTAVLSPAVRNPFVRKVLKVRPPACRTRPLSDDDNGEDMEGIEFWAIEFDFKVS